MSQVTATEEITVEHVPIGDLRPDPFNPRRISEADLEPLPRRIRESDTTPQSGGTRSTSEGRWQ